MVTDIRCWIPTSRLVQIHQSNRKSVKRPIVLVLFILLVPSFLSAQTDDPVFLSLEFLEINAQAQSKGMGDLGVVSPRDNSHSATHQNPALLIREERQFDATFKYMPWLRVYGLRHFFLEVGGQAALSERHAFGLNLKYLSDGALRMPPDGFKSDYVVAMSYAYKLSRKFAAGASYKLIRNQVITSDGSIGHNSWAVDLGVHHRSVKALRSGNDLYWNWAVALSNFGPRIELSELLPNLPYNNHLPTTLRVGTLWSIEKKPSQRYTYSYAFGYQVDKRLSPLPTGIDTNGDGIPDHQQWSLFKSILQSFSDDPAGWQGELGDLVHKLGFEYRVADHRYDYSLAFRLGYHAAKATLFNRQNISAGLAVAYKHFYIDLAYVTSLSIDNPLYENTFLFSIGSRQQLQAGK